MNNYKFTYWYNGKELTANPYPYTIEYRSTTIAPEILELEKIVNELNKVEVVETITFT